MKCSLGSSNFLEEISSLSHSIVFLYFFALIIKQGFLISPCYSLELSCFFHDPADVGNLISGSSAFSKTSLKFWKFMVHILLKPGLENFEQYFASMWDECICAVVWRFFCIAFLWDWNENWTFPVLWPLLSFPNCWHIDCSTFTT